MKDNKKVVFSQHALDRLFERGATREEVVASIASGESIVAKNGRVAFRKNFPFEAAWKNRRYEVKQVMPIIVEKEDRLVVVTVYVFYIGGKE